MIIIDQQWEENFQEYLQLLQDPSYDDVIFEWAIKDKFHDAKKQGVECVILYFHKKELYSLERVEDGWNKYLNDYSSQKYTTAIKRVLCIVENNIIEYPVQ